MLCLATSSFALMGCDMTQNQLKTDRAANLENQDYRDGLASRMALEEAQDTAELDHGIPSLQSYVAQPSENLRSMPLVSISVNQTVPLRDVIFELAKQVDYDVELDPRISGSIIFTAREKPFDEVIRRIAEISGLRYSFDSNDVLRVELDTPFSKTYKVDYLNYTRNNNSSVRNDIAVVTGSGTNTGSGFEATGESKSDFWGEMTANLQQILGVMPGGGNLKTGVDPQITAAEQNPAPVMPAMVGGETAAGEGQPTVQVQAPQAVLQVSSLPTVNDQNQEDREARDKDQASFSINKQAGMISVFATERQHKEVAEYLEQIKRSTSAQVLVEAKILEVSLRDEYSTGINWSEISVTGKSALQLLFPQQAFLDGTATGGVGTTMTIGGNDVNAVINALSQFGTVRALASPRLTVLNNQSAVLNVAQNLVYFEVDIETTTADNVVTVTLDSEIRNVPEGVIINVLPSINMLDQTISMAVRPTVTNVDEFAFDPAVDIQAATAGFGPGTNNSVRSPVPIVQVQEFDSVINMNSGQAVVLGGLMQDRHRTNEQGVPVLSDIPFIGNAFKNHVDEITKTELIVFLKATIMDGTNVHNTDRDLYKMYSQDRRPLGL
ncbi:MAG: type II and III secretion system family protein [Alphaproteobacteria bacterium CG_4_9_14_3_um_filter_47_13]|nr:MAG: type II and III secretion system family protein [Alphaproteobacteria bacterium CG_4_9_14_3_um_filter_47_13]